MVLLCDSGEAKAFAKAYGKPIPVQWVTCADYPKDNPAVKYGTSEVTELQYQGRVENAAAYRKYITEAVKAIHAAAKHARIMGGLATDPVGQGVPVCDIIHSYFATKEMLIGYWLNSSSHTAEALAFFEDIGAIAGRKIKC